MKAQGFSVPAEERYFEDYVSGSVHEFGPVTMEESEIIEFGKRFVPQPYHTDPELAKKTIYGGIIASGWHTAAAMMRVYSDNYLSRVANLGSPGVDELRWNKPVRAGDRLAIRVTVLETRRSRSRPERGIVVSLVETLNQHGEVVMSMKMTNFMTARQGPARESGGDPSAARGST